jgi:hypothetical protein
MFKKKLPQWSMLPAEVEVTHFYGTWSEVRAGMTYMEPEVRVGLTYRKSG